jgi:hypothetical protein
MATIHPEINPVLTSPMLIALRTKLEGLIFISGFMAILNGMND